MWDLAKESASAWSDDYAASMGAALAYYTLFSLAPLLLLVISVAGLVYGAEAAQGAVIAQFGGLIGKEGSSAIQGLLKSASHPATSLFLTMEVVNQIVSLAFVTALFALMYRILPSVRVAWRDVWHGAFATGVLFTVGKFLIGLYLGQAGVESGFGAAGSVVVLLVWVFYSAQIFLLGAEFTWWAASVRCTPARSPGADARRHAVRDRRCRC